MMAKRVTALQIKYRGWVDEPRPFFVDEESWAMFIAHVREGRTLTDIAAESGLPAFRVSQALARVDRRMDLPRGDAGSANGVTLDSPIQDLGLSLRAENALRESGCDTVRSILERDIRRIVRRVGPVTRLEITSALEEHGFTVQPPTEEAGQATVTELVQSLQRLRHRLRATFEEWSDEVTKLEKRVRKLAEQVHPRPRS
jgi:hypothetical protein